MVAPVCQPEAAGQVVLAILDEVRYAFGDVTNPVGNRDAVLRQKSPDLIGLCRLRFDESLPGTMHTQDGLLLAALLVGTKQMPKNMWTQCMMRVPCVV